MSATALSRSCWRSVVMSSKSEPSPAQTPPAAFTWCAATAAILPRYRVDGGSSVATRRRRRSASGAPRGYSSPACALHELAPRGKDAGGDIRIKRIYEPADARDGYRALVDRLWPRGMSREHAAIDEWLPVLAPST